MRRLGRRRCDRAAGLYHSLALKSDGTVWAWGNAQGQLGDGTTTDRTSPVPAIGLTDVAAVAAGGVHSLALRNDGTVWAWGANWYGQFGDGTNVSNPIPMPTVAYGDAVAIACGLFFSLAIRADGTVWACGRNDAGQVGDGTNTERWSPVTVQGLTQVVAIGAGDEHGLALRGLNRLTGSVAFGDLTGDPTVRPVLIEIRDLGGATPLESHVVFANADGIWEFATAVAGTRDLAAKGETWLRTVVSNVDLDGDPAGLAFVLTNGDVNGDNSVNIQDFLVLRAAFGSNGGSPNWNQNADLNKDGSVNIQDFLILRRCFGQAGAP